MIGAFVLPLRFFGRPAVALKLGANCSNYVFHFTACEQPSPVWRRWEAVVNLIADVSGRSRACDYEGRAWRTQPKRGKKALGHFLAKCAA